MQHFQLVSDPGTHNYKEALVSVLWCWEIQQAFHCPWQFLVPGKVMTPDDTCMDEEAERFAAKLELIRVASFRQVQGYSNQLEAMTRFCYPRLKITSFTMPETFHVRPINTNEVRGTKKGEIQDVSYLINIITRVETPILPDRPTTVRMLSLGLDQGAVGCAGAAFMMFHLGLMVRVARNHHTHPGIV